MSGIRAIFDEAAATYDRVNRALTFGLDTLWRRTAARTALAGVPAEGARVLDVCAGTGDMTADLVRRLGSGGRVVGVDFCEAMVRRALVKRAARDAAHTLGSVDALPFADGAFDAATISFAGRNLNTDRAAFVRRLAEVRRVLKPAGVLVIVETTQPRAAWVRAGLRLYTRTLVRYAGWAISGSRSAYGYLAQSIPRFYTADALAGVLREAGFGAVSYRYLTLGVVAVHAAWRQRGGGSDHG